MPKTVKTVHIEVNDAGGWRRVMSFDTADEAEVLHQAGELLQWATNRDRIKARVIIPGDTAPLMNWSYAEGWREWVSPADAAAARAQRSVL